MTIPQFAINAIVVVAIVILSPILVPLMLLLEMWQRQKARRQSAD